RWVKTALEGFRSEEVKKKRGLRRQRRFCRLSPLKLLYLLLFKSTKPSEAFLSLLICNLNL
ncbi:MAG: hypothetical protein Q8O88_02280, partial [bacterium]|nr:hypothetical protein [bacterium]